MRETCLFCVSKHISQAIVLVSESAKGYPMHLWYAVGHLGEAEDECSGEFPDLTYAIRDTRLALMGQCGTFRHTALPALLETVRAIAAKSNGIEEYERVGKILRGEDVSGVGSAPEVTPIIPEPSAFINGAKYLCTIANFAGNQLELLPELKIGDKIIAAFEEGFFYSSVKNDKYRCTWGKDRFSNIIPYIEPADEYQILPEGKGGIEL